MDRAKQVGIDLFFVLVKLSVIGDEMSYVPCFLLYYLITFTIC